MKRIGAAHANRGRSSVLSRAVAKGSLAGLATTAAVALSGLREAGSGAVVGGLAYLVDYHLIPRRLTPGWELRVSRGSVALGFAALGLSLGLAAVLRTRR
jgi:hypothetical protein